MATLSTLRNAVYSKLGMDSTAAGNDETLVTQWLNEGVREVLLRTHCYVSAIDLTLTADEWKYDMDTSVMALLQAWDSNNNPVDIINMDDLLDLRYSDSSSYTFGSGNTKMAMLGANMFAVWPTPSDAGTLSAFYVPKPTEMSSGTHDPSNTTYGGVPVQFHKAIELWALKEGSDHEHEARTKSGMQYEAAFDKYIGQLVRPSVNRMQGRKGPARLGRMRGVPSNRSTYPRY